MIVPYLTIASSTKGGRGVFTTRNISANTIIEISPVIVLTVKDRAIVEETSLYGYIFEWGGSKKKGCLALGYVSLYNHDYAANCDYDMDFEHDLMTIRTVRKIASGEELYVNYNAHPDDKTKVWFKAK